MLGLKLQLFTEHQFVEFITLSMLQSDGLYTTNSAYIDQFAAVVPFSRSRVGYLEYLCSSQVQNFHMVISSKSNVDSRPSR
jgi:hypothetical protein